MEAYLTSSPVFMTLLEDVQIRTSFSKATLRTLLSSSRSPLSFFIWYPPLLSSSPLVPSSSKHLLSALVFLSFLSFSSFSLPLLLLSFLVSSFFLLPPFSSFQSFFSLFLSFLCTSPPLLLFFLFFLFLSQLLSYSLLSWSPSQLMPWPRSAAPTRVSCS